MLSSRPELESRPDDEEVSIRLSILPIRLNIDQVLHSECVSSHWSASLSSLISPSSWSCIHVYSRAAEDEIEKIMVKFTCNVTDVFVLH